MQPFARIPRHGALLTRRPFTSTSREVTTTTVECSSMLVLFNLRQTSDIRMRLRLETCTGTCTNDDELSGYALMIVNANRLIWLYELFKSTLTRTRYFLVIPTLASS
jgi:hypothetical protein